MPARWLALLLALALLPTVELVEQGTHAVEHVVAGDAPDHDAHHEDGPRGEHGCTELVHVCGGHHGLGVTPPVVGSPRLAAPPGAAPPAVEPTELHDLDPRTPPYRPPIG